MIIVAFFGVWAAKMLDDNEAHAAGGRVVTVIGYSFGFEYRYDSDGGFTRNDGLYVPVDESVALHMVTPLFTPGRRISRSSTASGCPSGASSRTPRRA